MAYCGYVITLKNVRPHPNADRMKLADCFGNTVCVGLDAAEGELGVYFPTDGQLSVEFCAQNDLVRRKDENGNPAGGYLDPDKRNIRTIKLRGEKSDGLFMPISAFAYTGVNFDEWDIGTTITVVNGHDICQKYIPRSNAKTGGARGGNKTRKRKDPIAPLFQEHADTEQLAYNLAAFRPGDEIEITLKMHGTSQRTAHLPALCGYNDPWYYKLYNWAWFHWNRLTHQHDYSATINGFKHKNPNYEYDYVSGTRRVVLDTYDGGFYGSNEFREQHSKTFEGKLWKGETVYYEVVGFTHTGAPIMASAPNSKVSDKEFTKMYGKETVFSYGCSADTAVFMDGEAFNTSNCVNAPKQSDIYVYRMTMTNEDGEVVEYTPDFMRYRCEQMGVKTVPVLWKGVIPTHKPIGMWNEEDRANDTPGYRPPIDAGEYVKFMAEQYYDGPDPIGKTHIREGVVVRILNRPKFTAYKHKNFYFKIISGIAIEQAENNGIADAISEDILAEM